MTHVLMLKMGCCIIEDLIMSKAVIPTASLGLINPALPNAPAIKPAVIIAGALEE